MSKLTSTRKSSAQIQSNTRPSDANHRSRGWLLTLNNPTELDHAKAVAFAGDCAGYGIIAKEVGKTGVPHLQCYFQMKTSYLGQTLVNKISKRAWCGIANHPVKSREYCMKDGDFIEVGEFKDTSTQAVAKKGGAGTKAKWATLHEEIKAGIDFETLQDKYPAMVYQTETAIRNSIARRAPKRNFKTCVHVYFGEAGTGKTTRAKADAPNAFVHTPLLAHWFDGYDGRSNVVIDEMRKGQFQLSSLLSLLDEHPCTVQVKQGSINFAPKTLVITSNHPPQEWYKPETLDPNSMAALFRRINVLKEFTKNGIQDYETVHELYRSGCICNHEPKLTKNGTLIIPESPPPSPKAKKTLKTLKRQLATSEFVPVPSNPLVLEETSTSAPPQPKKRRLLKDLPNKSVGPLTKQMDELYPDPVRPFTWQRTEDLHPSVKTLGSLGSYSKVPAAGNSRNPIEVEEESDSDDVSYAGDYGDVPLDDPIDSFDSDENEEDDPISSNESQE